MRRGAPVALVVAGLLLLLASYVYYTRRIVQQLRDEAAAEGRMFARVYAALNDPEESGTAALLDLSRHIRELGVPVVVTDAGGQVTAAANLPFDAATASPERLAAYAAELDRQNPPIVERGIGTVHYGNPPIVRGLRVVPLLQAIALSALLLAGAYILHIRGRAERERLWAGMARESAHQLGTPLSSLEGWVALLEEHAEQPLLATAAAHMRGDLDRLEQVAHRFERIGRPPRREPVELGALVERITSYFRARAPTLAHAVTITAERPAEPLRVEGDPVLLEWVLEALVRNSVDALAGRGGRVVVSAAPRAEGGAVVTVTDDGPGVARELRGSLFEPGVSSKPGGWGIGLTLARRIVEEWHGGTIRLVPTDRGATFEIILG